MSTKQAKKQEFKELIQQIDYELNEFSLDPHKWDNFLPCLMNKYSLRNNLIIAKNHASIVKTINAWHKVGTKVKKGEKAIWLLSPSTARFIEVEGKEILYNKATEEQKQNNKPYTKIIGGYRPFPVFNITQTELKKEEYPDDYFKYYKFIENNGYDITKMENLFDYLISRAYDIYGINVKYENTKTMHGYVNIELKQVVLNKSASLRNNIQTFLHELSHFILKHDYKKTSRAICEFEAELAGYLVGSALGIKDKETSLSYVKEWTNDLKILTEKQRLKSIEEAISTYKQIFKEFELTTFADKYEFY
ncbi:ImmA/IrrE family metallo-endopeptidase [Mycoplasma zalophidermidis]|uniref:ImmA/IrrE family metallo-endopeptidase n=1 Tax=Mycoplasma zalophidermidis TaxID=398174 RepID=UPI001C0FD5AF|nr:ImmA/IrrE family metallo-endopeptidase [Mycoplasma zalophidermidis]MBU4690057.1 ImmA/IrrE family metallo-endopeptidase [Mycoplasma zalophidermidis]